MPKKGFKYANLALGAKPKKYEGEFKYAWKMPILEETTYLKIHYDCIFIEGSAIL